MVIKRAVLLLLGASSTLLFVRLAAAHKAISEEDELGIASTASNTSNGGLDSNAEDKSPLDRHVE